MKKICIVGAGAIGGFLGTRLAAAGHSVSALARGATLQALRTQGWRLKTAQGQIQAPAHAHSDAQLLGPKTVVMPAMNGVPWWFCAGQPGFGPSLQSVDPGGAIASAIGMERVMGCVVHASTFTPEPGLVQHRMGQGLLIGEPRGGVSERVQQATALMASAGFEAVASANIRYDIWYKLWGNLTMNPVSALTGATADRILADPLVRAFCSAAMVEAQAVGERLGCPIEQSPEDRHAITARLGAFKTSMLQDVEAGRPIELDAIVGAVCEIAQVLGLATPHIDALMGLTRLLAQTRQLYPPARP